MVLLLLELDVHPNAQPGVFGYALQAASLAYSKRCVLWLLDHDADVNADSGLTGTALQAAALSGKLETVELLSRQVPM